MLIHLRVTLANALIGSMYVIITVKPAMEEAKYTNQVYQSSISMVFHWQFYVIF